MRIARYCLVAATAMCWATGGGADAPRDEKATPRRRPAVREHLPERADGQHLAGRKRPAPTTRPVDTHRDQRNLRKYAGGRRMVRADRQGVTNHEHVSPARAEPRNHGRPSRLGRVRGGGNSGLKPPGLWLNLFPGNARTAEEWITSIEGWHDQGFRVLVWNTPGTGRPPGDVPPFWQIPDEA